VVHAYDESLLSSTMSELYTLACWRAALLRASTALVSLMLTGVVIMKVLPGHWNLGAVIDEAPFRDPRGIHQHRAAVIVAMWQVGQWGMCSKS
jgi:hypothetical protein